MPAVRLAHGPGGGPLHHLAGIAQQLEQHRVLPAQPSQRFCRGLPDQRVRRCRGPSYLRAHAVRHRIPDAIELLKHFHRIG